MKVYVRGFRTKTEDEIAEERKRAPFSVIEPLIIAYEEAPDGLIISSRWEAECFCRELLGVHVGDHYCQFSIDELANERFAIACLSHPDR